MLEPWWPNTQCAGAKLLFLSKERLVPDNESIFSTLLEWGSDLEDVKFYLRPREDIPTYTQAANGKICNASYLVSLT